MQLSTGVAPNGADSASPESASGSLASIDISVGVGYEGSDGRAAAVSTTVAVHCGNATVLTSPEGDDGDEAITEGKTDTEASAGNEAEDAATEDGTDIEPASSADADETNSGGTSDTEATSGTSADDVTELTNTGAGKASNGSASRVLVTLLSGVAAKQTLTEPRLCGDGNRVTIRIGPA